jgi:DNA-binding MarR family transcriptional regulator
MQERGGANSGADAQAGASDGGGQLKSSRVTLTDQRALAAFRYELRCFLAFSEQAARAAGVEPQQHQLLLAVGGLPAGARPNIRTLAERLCVQHHTTVALVDKLELRDLVRRERSTEDKREVLVRLTPAGTELLQQLSRQHRKQLQSVGPEMLAALGAILDRRGWDTRENVG